MATGSHLVIAEDDEFVQQLLAVYFQHEGFRVSLAGSGEELLTTLEEGSVDLILLDLGLPDEDGLVLIRKIRFRSTIPIVILTGRQEHEDRISALEMGADDYLTKPCDPKELVLRVQNLLNRSSANPLGAMTHQSPPRVSFEGWILNLSSRTLRNSTGNEVHLSRTEFNLLAALVIAAHRVLSRAQLLDAISQHDSSPSERMIDVIVARLRRKLEPDPKNPRIIRTIIGVGYKFAAMIEHVESN